MPLDEHGKMFAENKSAQPYALLDREYIWEEQGDLKIIIRIRSSLPHLFRLLLSSIVGQQLVCGFFYSSVVLIT